MDRSAAARKRRQGPAQPTTKPPVRLSRDKKDGQKNRNTKGSTESTASATRVDTAGRASVEKDLPAKSFTVGNVGRNGTLYLKPSRVTPVQLTQTPATPPKTAGKTEENVTGSSKQQERGVASAISPRISKPAPTAFNATPALPLLGAESPVSRTRTRSHSFSTISDAVKAQPHETAEFQILLNGQDRPKSSFDIPEGLAGFRIPHYRLGTPRFSEYGTAYLHNSIRSSLTEDVRSSVFSQGEYDRFPAPPGRSSSLRANTRQFPGGQFLHPSRANSSQVSSRTSTRFRKNAPTRIDLAMYDHVEANINDPSMVRYSVSTGRIMAATPARLVAQITSPWFLDYELLSDFFLTYRSFLNAHTLLDYLLVRMEWALANGSDSGRIVTVRTFVAMRHWILNYFPDDFLPDFSLRQKFCDMVNDIAIALMHRHDGGGGDLNVVGELKKCWRRICAMFWDLPDIGVASPEVEIEPGEDEQSPRVRASATSMIQSGQDQGMYMDFRRSSIIRLPAPIEPAENEPNNRTSTASRGMQYSQNATIPATPQSAQSLTVLSCSVPFLRHMMPTREHITENRQRGSHYGKAPSERSTGTARRQNRSASFSDALRDERPPLSPVNPESVDDQSLPNTSFTGGLVRGLLLQPSPSTVELLIPLSPPLENSNFDFGTDPRSQDRDPTWQSSNVGVKKVVCDVRRALSHRKRDSPASSNRSTNSSGSRNSGQSEKVDHPVSWQQLSGPPRVDVLGEKIESIYREAFDESAILNIAPPLSEAFRREPGMRLDLLQGTDRERLNSHVTTGSRSIVIVDDTGLPGAPMASGGLPPLTPRSRAMAPKSLFSNSPNIPQGFQDDAFYQDNAAAGSSDDPLLSSGMPLHDLLIVPGSSRGADGEALDVSQARKSSSAHPAVLDMPPIRGQLRRRPGGDLRGIDNVQDLERSPRPETEDSYSTFSQAIVSSGEPSVDLSNVHVVGQDDHGMQIPLSFLQGRQRESWTLLPTHSSQPNMRASMKEKVSHLAALPDDNFEGGIEDALAKLEGKSSTPSSSVYLTKGKEVEPKTLVSGRHSQPTRLQVINVAADDPAIISAAESRSPLTDRQGASIYHMSDDTQTDSLVYARSQEGKAIRQSAEKGSIPPLPTLTSLSESALHVLNARAASIDRQKLQTSDSQRSFLLDDNQSFSDISTEIADEHSADEDNIGVRSFYFDDPAEDDIRPAAPFRPPPTPPSTGGAAGTRSQPTSPGFPPGAADVRSIKGAMGAQAARSNPPPPKEAGTYTRPLSNKTAHLPWVLAYESDIIAEQLTIIEKDALDEVDWKDLISLNWRQSPCPIQNWVDFLQREDGSGIDIVVARFNLVVKWVVSECVLTDVPSERARCITKFIHVAERAHRLRNYATMYQITLALLSSDISRLQKTWSLVPQAEKTLLTRLEKLCQPRGNFHQLRAEMELASAEDACIPFIGLYTHDLMFNAQKPSRLNPTPPGGEPLVNFERYQTAAAIVKGLLTLIEASARYVFRPHPEVLSRCLWLAALPDGEIGSRSRDLER